MADPLVAAARELVKKGAPKHLDGVWHISGTDPRNRMLPGRLESVLNLDILAIVMDQVRGPGITLTATIGSGVTQETVQLMVQARRPDSTWNWRGQVEADVTKYLMDYGYTAVRQNSADTSGHTLAQGLEGAVPGEGPLGWAQEGLSARDTSGTGEGRSTTATGHHHAGITTSGTADIYDGPKTTVTIALKRVVKPGKAINRLGLNLPHMFMRIRYRVADTDRTDLQTEIPLIERVVVPREYQPDPAQMGTLELPEDQMADGAPDAVNTTGSATEPTGRPQPLSHTVVEIPYGTSAKDLGLRPFELKPTDLSRLTIAPLGARPEALAKVFKEFRRALSGEAPPKSGDRSSAPAQFAEWGNASIAALQLFLSSTLMISRLGQLTEPGGYQLPPISLPGVIGRLHIGLELYNPVPLNWMGARAAEALARQEETQWSVTRTEAVAHAAGISGLLHTGVTDHTGQSLDVVPALDGTSLTAEVRSTEVATRLTPTHRSTARTIPNWLRVGTGALLHLKLSAGETDGLFDSTGEVRMSFRLDRFLELLAGPEAVVPRGLAHKLGIPTPSGRYFPWVHDDSEMLQAALNFPKYANTQVLHLHTNQKGLITHFDRELTYEAFVEQVLPGLDFEHDGRQDEGLLRVLSLCPWEGQQVQDRFELAEKFRTGGATTVLVPNRTVWTFGVDTVLAVELEETADGSLKGVLGSFEEYGEGGLLQIHGADLQFTLATRMGRRTANTRPANVRQLAHKVKWGVNTSTAKDAEHLVPTTRVGHRRKTSDASSLLSVSSVKSAAEELVGPGAPKNLTDAAEAFVQALGGVFTEQITQFGADSETSGPLHVPGAEPTASTMVEQWPVQSPRPKARSADELWQSAIAKAKDASVLHHLFLALKDGLDPDRVNELISAVRGWPATVAATAEQDYNQIAERYVADLVTQVLEGTGSHAALVALRSVEAAAAAIERMRQDPALDKSTPDGPERLASSALENMVSTVVGNTVGEKPMPTSFASPVVSPVSSLSLSPKSGGSTRPRRGSAPDEAARAVAAVGPMLTSEQVQEAALLAGKVAVAAAELSAAAVAASSSAPGPALLTDRLRGATAEIQRAGKASFRAAADARRQQAAQDEAAAERRFAEEMVSAKARFDSALHMARDPQHRRDLNRLREVTEGRLRAEVEAAREKARNKYARAQSWAQADPETQSAALSAQDEARDRLLTQSTEGSAFRQLTDAVRTVLEYSTLLDTIDSSRAALIRAAAPEETLLKRKQRLWQSEEQGTLENRDGFVLVTKPSDESLNQGTTPTPAHGFFRKVIVSGQQLSSHLRRPIEVQADSDMDSLLGSDSSHHDVESDLQLSPVTGEVPSPEDHSVVTAAAGTGVFDALSSLSPTTSSLLEPFDTVVLGGRRASTHSETVRQAGAQVLLPPLTPVTATKSLLDPELVSRLYAQVHLALDLAYPGLLRTDATVTDDMATPAQLMAALKSKAAQDALDASGLPWNRARADRRDNNEKALKAALSPELLALGLESGTAYDVQLKRVGLGRTTAVTLQIGVVVGALRDARVSVFATTHERLPKAVRGLLPGSAKLASDTGRTTKSRTTLVSDFRIPVPLIEGPYSNAGQPSGQLPAPAFAREFVLSSGATLGREALERAVLRRALTLVDQETFNRLARGFRNHRTDHGTFLLALHVSSTGEFFAGIGGEDPALHRVDAGEIGQVVKRIVDEINRVAKTDGTKPAVRAVQFIGISSQTAVLQVSRPPTDPGGTQPIPRDVRVARDLERVSEIVGVPVLGLPEDFTEVVEELSGELIGERYVPRQDGGGVDAEVAEWEQHSGPTVERSDEYLTDFLGRVRSRDLPSAVNARDGIVFSAQDQQLINVVPNSVRRRDMFVVRIPTKSFGADLGLPVLPVRSLGKTAEQPVARPKEFAEQLLLEGLKEGQDIALATSVTGQQHFDRLNAWLTAVQEHLLDRFLERRKSKPGISMTEPLAVSIHVPPPGHHADEQDGKLLLKRLEEFPQSTTRAEWRTTTLTRKDVPATESVYVAHQGTLRRRDEPVLHWVGRAAFSDDTYRQFDRGLFRDQVSDFESFLVLDDMPLPESRQTWPAVQFGDMKQPLAPAIVDSLVRPFVKLGRPKNGQRQLQVLHMLFNAPADPFRYSLLEKVVQEIADRTQLLVLIPEAGAHGTRDRNHQGVPKSVARKGTAPAGWNAIAPANWAFHPGRIDVIDGFLDYVPYPSTHMVREGSAVLLASVPPEQRGLVRQLAARLTPVPKLVRVLVEFRNGSPVLNYVSNGRIVRTDSDVDRFADWLQAMVELKRDTTVQILHWQRVRGERTKWAPTSLTYRDWYGDANDAQYTTLKTFGEVLRTKMPSRVIFTQAWRLANGDAVAVSPLDHTMRADWDGLPKFGESGLNDNSPLASDPLGRVRDQNAPWAMKLGDGVAVLDRRISATQLAKAGREFEEWTERLNRWLRETAPDGQTPAAFPVALPVVEGEPVIYFPQWTGRVTAGLDAVLKEGGYHPSRALILGVHPSVRLRTLEGLRQQLEQRHGVPVRLAHMPRALHAALYMADPATTRRMVPQQLPPMPPPEPPRADLWVTSARRPSLPVPGTPVDADPEWAETIREAYERSRPVDTRRMSLPPLDLPPESPLSDELSRRMSLPLPQELAGTSVEEPE
ncbi:hypothetical protein ACWGI8_34350, partial [Streptomyces sp. NPDC054841]